jgi:hypothetical protein
MKLAGSSPAPPASWLLRRGHGCMAAAPNLVWFVKSPWLTAVDDPESAILVLVGVALVATRPSARPPGYTSFRALVPLRSRVLANAVMIVRIRGERNANSGDS